MLDYRFTISKYFLILLLILTGLQKLHAQKVVQTEEVIKNFAAELQQVNTSSDTVIIYQNYIKRLIARGNYIQADSILQATESDFIALDDPLLLASIYKERAHMYKVQRRYDKALEDYLWLKSFFEERDSHQDLIEVYSSIAEYYRAIAQHELSDTHLKLAESLIRESGTSNERLAYWYSRKAAWSNEALGNSDSIVYYANEGLKLLTDTTGIHTKALLLNELGFLSMNSLLGKDTIFSYFNQSKNLLFQNERYRDYVEIVNNMAIYNYRYGSMPEGIQLMESIVQMEEDNNWYAPLEVTYNYLTGLYRDTGQKEKSIEMREKALLATIKNLQNFHQIQVNDLALTYEKDFAEKELQSQEQKTLLAEAEADSNQRAFIIAATIAIVLLFIAIISFQVNLRFRRKNEQLNDQREQIQNTNVDLEKSLNQQRILFKELNHRVKNNLSILTGLIYLQEVGESDGNFKNTLSTLRSRIKSMALAHESLYNSEEAGNIDFQAYLRELFIDMQNALVEAHKVKTQIECQNFQLGLEEAVPLAMIINELFTNSVKHGFKDSNEGFIMVKAHHERDYSIVEYTDNGTGFSLEQKEKKTLGLRLIKLLLEQLDATLEDKSESSGVHLVIQIPTAETE